MSMKNMISDVESMIKLAEFFIKLSSYQYTFDHPKMGLECYTTAKMLLYWAKVGLEERP